MEATTIVPQAARRMSIEAEALAFEVFCTTYGADWQHAIDTALAELPSLLDYAQTWDCAALTAGNPAAECPF